MTPDDFLAALEDDRAEREHLHPHRPVLTPRHLRSVQATELDDSDPHALSGAETTGEHEERGRYLSQAERDHGRARIAALRAVIEENRTRRGTAS